MDTPEKPVGSCVKCGKDIEVDKTYCDQCAIEMTEENIPDAEGIMPAPTRSRRMTLIQVVILLACLAVIAFQLPKVTDVFKESRPLRQGSWETDQVTDECIRKLWRISRILQDGGLPGDDIACPASGKPYLIVGSGRDITVHCPNPEFHGVADISVSAGSPRPKVKP